MDYWTVDLEKWGWRCAWVSVVAALVAAGLLIDDPAVAPLSMADPSQAWGPHDIDLVSLDLQLLGLAVALAAVMVSLVALIVIVPLSWIRRRRPRRP